jgi:hypothetical protein
MVLSHDEALLAFRAQLDGRTDHDSSEPAHTEKEDT